MDHLFADTYPVRLVVPLLNFDCFTPSLEVTSCVTVTRLGDREKNNLIARLGAHREFPETGISIDALARSGWALEYSREVLRGHEIPYDELFTETDLAFAAIRLVKSGRVGAVAAIVLSDPAGHSIHHPPELCVSPGGSQFRMEEDDRNLLSSIVRGLEMPESKRLRIALRWFNRASVARWGDDIIMAVAIALEGALLPKETDELAFRLALRGAALVAEDGRQEEVFGVLGVLYVARSAIVHTGCSIAELPKNVVKKVRRLEGSPPPDAFPKIALDTARNVLTKLVLQTAPGIDHSQFLQALERQVIASFSGK